MNHGTIIFVPTNGSGLGHLTRSLALARRMKKLDKKLEIIFLSTSPAMHLIMREGFLGYYHPAKSAFLQNITIAQWNELLGKQLSTILRIHRPNMLVFDGAFPYDGILSSFDEDDSLKKIWIRRTQNKIGPDEQTRNHYNMFDKIVVPGEAGSALRKGNDEIHYCEPVIYLDRSELLSREAVRNEWRVKQDEKLVYIQLGAGNINDIHPVISMLLKVLKRRREIRIVLGESIIGKRLGFHNKNAMILRDYPNSIYFNAFDLAISASGYNTFHELMYFGVPTIFVPNENTGRDDQVERAINASKAGAGICLKNPDYDDFAQAMEIGLDPSINQRMRKAAMQLISRNGADDIAQLLLYYL
ncbi:glycosyltransferase [Cohnella suwonensis]|uniref:Glycosyltransferase n=1 Tax=Cohnella suwonensis TaxID=696072 RepID=A0ABW0LSD0_9BACL